MITFLIQLILMALCFFGSELFAYKFIRRIDKKERIKLKEWEKNLYIDKELKK